MTTTPIHSSHDRLVVCLDGEITPHGAREFVLAVDQRLERYFCEHLEVRPRRRPTPRAVLPSAVGGTAPSARGGCGASSAAVSCRFRRSECRPGRQRRAARLGTTVRRCATTRNHTGAWPKIGLGRPRLGGRSWAGSSRAFTSSIAAKRFLRRCSSAGSPSALAPRGDATPNGDKERAPAERENRSPPTMR